MSCHGWGFQSLLLFTGASRQFFEDTRDPAFCMVEDSIIVSLSEKGLGESSRGPRRGTGGVSEKNCLEARVNIIVETKTKE